ncbi:CMRF35-like molecule 1 isoform X2 [Kryptolebias marmoratus]|uniref:CMRF35-like molecule 1 isoform X2 n=1 Tax=Kryptolebias marmoratus TaxID=37003 RepID=UPI0007F884F8|nr:CMRF35-like molecule 1 isoform X2 [Kryptolebias marmoratus]
MKSILLLILLLITGFGASIEVKGCLGGWVEFTWKCCKTKNAKVNGTNLNEKDRFSLYHDTINENFQLKVRDLKHKDSGKYQCGLQTPTRNKSVNLKVVEKKDCQAPVYQVVHKTGETTIECDYEERYSSMTKFICKENNLTCEEISTPSSQASNGKFTLKNTSTGFNVSIREVSSLHDGGYWCAVKNNHGSYRAGLKRIKLKVKELTTFRKSTTTGQNLTFFCKYEENVENLTKFICKGEDETKCQPLANTTNTIINSRFLMKDNKTKKNITITVSKVTASDSGTYWCGAEKTDKQRSKIFTHRMSLTVATSKKVLPTTSPAPPATSGEVIKPVIISAVVLILLLLLIALIIIYKKCLGLKSTETRAEARQPKEEYVYEEIPDILPTSTTTIYATANFPTNTPDSLHYSTIVLPKSSSDKSDGEVLVLRPSSTSCQYSVLKSNQSSASFTDPPSRSTDEPLYSTVRKPQQK